LFLISVVTSDVETPDAALLLPPELATVRLLVFKVNDITISYVLVTPVIRNLSVGVIPYERPAIVELLGVRMTRVKSTP